MSSASSQSTLSTPNRAGSEDSEDDIELARGMAETDLKSEEEEILCNYGDKLLLDGVSEDAGDADGGEMVTTEMVQDGDAVVRLMSLPKPKPTQASWPATKVRFYVGGRLIEKEVFSGQDQGKEVKEGTEQEEDTEGESEEFGKCINFSLCTRVSTLSSPTDFSSLAPDDSYSSLTDYLVSLEKKKVACADGGGGGATTEDEDKKIVDKAADTAGAVSSFNLITSSKSSQPSAEE